MSEAAPLLAVDIGSHTIAAAAAIPSKRPDPETLSFRGRTDYPCGAKVDIEGVPHPATWKGTAEAVVRQPALLLDEPPQIIGDVPLSGVTLLSVTIGPAIAAARERFGQEPATIVGVHPQWSAPKIRDFQRALERQGQDVALTPWADAIAAQTTPPLTGSHVTVFDFGASSASVVLVKFTRRGTPSVKFSHTDSSGGARGADREVVAACANTAGVDLSAAPSNWWGAAERRINSARRRRPASSTDLDVAFPNPLGKQSLKWRDIDQITAAHMQSVVERLIDHQEIRDAWEADRTDTVVKPILESTGGFAADPSVELAVRAAIGPVTVVDEPAAAAAFGAALLQAPQWIPAPPPEARRSLFGRRKARA